jgi:hypothetical protein
MVQFARRKVSAGKGKNENEKVSAGKGNEEECVDIFVDGVTNENLLRVFALETVETDARKYLDFRRFGETGRVFMEFHCIGLPSGECYVEQGGVEYAIRLVRSGAIFKGKSGMEAMEVADAFLEREARRIFLSGTDFTNRLLFALLETVYKSTDALRNDRLANYLPRTCAVVVAGFCEGRPDLVAAALFPILSNGHDVFVFFHAAAKLHRAEERHKWLVGIVNEWIGIQLLMESRRRKVVTDADDVLVILSAIVRREGGSTVDAVTAAMGAASQDEIVDAAAYVVDSLVRRWIVRGKYRQGLDTTTAYIEISLHAAAAIAAVSSRFTPGQRQIEPEDVLAAMQFTSMANAECTCEQKESWHDNVLHPLGIPACLHPHKCFTDRVHFSRFGRQVCTTSLSLMACPSRCTKCSWFAGLLSVIDDSVCYSQMGVVGIGPSTWFRFLDTCTENSETPRSLLATDYSKAEISLPITDEEDLLDTARRFVLTWF